jgi:hypothetical protein
MNKELLNSLHVRNEIKAWVHDSSESRISSVDFAEKHKDKKLKDELEFLDSVKALPESEREEKVAEAIQSKLVRKRFIEVFVAHCFDNPPEVQLQGLVNIAATNNKLAEILGSPFESAPESDKPDESRSAEEQYQLFSMDLINILERVEKWRTATFFAVLAMIHLMHTWKIKVKDSNESLAEATAQRLCRIYGMKTSQRSLERIYMVASAATGKLSGGSIPENPLSEKYLKWWTGLIESIGNRAQSGPKAFHDLSTEIAVLPGSLKNQIGISATNSTPAKYSNIEELVAAVNALSGPKRSAAIQRQIKRLLEAAEILKEVDLDGSDIDPVTLEAIIEAIKGLKEKVKDMEEG